MVKEGKAIPVTGRGGPEGCEMSRLPHFLDIRLTDGGEVVSLMHQPSSTLRKIPGTHFCYRLRWPQGHSVAGRIRSIEKNPMASSGIEHTTFRFVTQCLNHVTACPSYHIYSIQTLNITDNVNLSN
jgi:hypothetical protein